MKNKKKTISVICGEKIKRIADNYLFADANSATCLVLHQPKAPKELREFRIRKD